jgi:mannosylglycerate hydrolase
VVEIDSLLESRWRDGMLPHLRYDSRFVADYFPGPEWWPRAPEHVQERGLLTSGISNPPVLPTTVRLVGERQDDVARRHALWRRTLPSLTAWLRWFLDRRRVAGAGMPVVVHPWEAGWDNSPRWDRAGTAGLKPSRAYTRLDTLHVASTERPSARDYDAYLRLAELLDGCDYELAGYLRQSPFGVNDLLVDALWYGAALDVNTMAAAIGDPAPFSDAELAAYAEAFDAAHRDGESGRYFDRDALTGEPIRVQSAAAVAALAGGLIQADRASLVWEAYARASAGARLVCTVPPTAPEFEPARYWRGPVWLSVNWLVERGLRRSGLVSAADQVRIESLDLVERGGFWEYFDALSGEGRGIEGFTWTAALVLDFLER